MPLRQSAVLSTLVISTRVLLDESPDQRSNHRGMRAILAIYYADLTYTSGPPGLVLIVGRWAA